MHTPLEDTGPVNGMNKIAAPIGKMTVLEVTKGASTAEKDVKEGQSEGE